ncbi:hypothetical protein KYY02_17070 [Streptomyces pimonensis]|uniref:Helix-turn-helix DNA binding domain protein n=1 Tax=Streptomyces pimonensis TaxID=2860288 RepID=A0ABV4J077_9ACTN
MKPLAEHGTTARAKGRPTAGIKGCPCRPCRDAENTYDKRRRFLNESGRTRMVDAKPTQAHLKKLFAEGAGWTQLIAATSCSSSTLVAILNGERAEITRRVANQVLAVQAADVQPPHRPIPAIGSIRRCHALVAIGHKLIDIADASRLDFATIRYIVSTQPGNVSARTAAAVASAYDNLRGQPGKSVRSLNRAAREGWRDPQWWEDYGHIDDPAFDPAKADAELNFHQRAALRREEIIHLAWCGHEPEQILDRLNSEVSISTIRAIVHEWRTGQKRDRKQAAAEPEMEAAA